MSAILVLRREAFVWLSSVHAYARSDCLSKYEEEDGDDGARWRTTKGKQDDDTPRLLTLKLHV